MQYQNVIMGIFKDRPNRFIAHVEIEGRFELCHVKNTGRCRELLIPGVTVYLTKADNPNRKTKYDLIAVKKGDMLVNMDSQIPNHAAMEWVLAGGLGIDFTELKQEVTHGNSRFDLWGRQKNGTETFIEVKGVTLEENGIARFPDAPTERGVKHIRELMHCVQEGYEAYILFVVQMSGMRWFEPNGKTHPQFGTVLKEARAAGVHVIAAECVVRPDRLSIDKMIDVRL